MPGLNWIVPAIDRMFLVNVTELMINAERSRNGGTHESDLS